MLRKKKERKRKEKGLYSFFWKTLDIHMKKIKVEMRGKNNSNEFLNNSASLKKLACVTSQDRLTRHLIPHG